MEYLLKCMYNGCYRIRIPIQLETLSGKGALNLAKLVFFQKAVQNVLLAECLLGNKYTFISLCS